MGGSWHAVRPILIAAAFLVVCSLLAWWSIAKTEVALTPSVLAQQFCVPIPAEAKVPESAAAAHILKAEVRPDSASIGGESFRAVSAMKGDVIQIDVHSLVAGAIGVHGVSEIVPVQLGEEVALRFRAIYSGRFPVHFHGVDGSHFELIVLNVADNVD